MQQKEREMNEKENMPKLECIKDWPNGAGTLSYTKGEVYEVQCIGVCDQTYQYVLLTNQGVVHVVTIWGEEQEEFDMHFKRLDS